MNQNLTYYAHYSREMALFGGVGVKGQSRRNGGTWRQTDGRFADENHVLSYTDH